MPREITRQSHALRARRLTVRRVEELTPRLRRVVLTGDDLESDFPFPAFASADHVKIVVPDDDGGELSLPTIVDGRPVPAPGAPQTRRDYTVRRFDAETRELTIDFVLHEHGPAGRWAARAAAGDVLGVVGPRGSKIFPGDYTRHLFVADETAQPAVGRFLDDLDGRPATVVGISATPEEFAPYGERPGVVLRSLVIPVDGDREAALTAALASEDLDDEELFIWMAGEARSLVPARRLLRERGIPRERWEVDGYWKTGEAGRDHHADLED